MGRAKKFSASSGRPPIYEYERRQFTLKIDVDLFEKARKLAMDAGISVTEWIAEAMESQIKAERRAGKGAKWSY